ncbi:MAG: hypothetical protein ACYC91_02320 [Solirubrobacteraceae bacterium]
MPFGSEVPAQLVPSPQLIVALASGQTSPPTTLPPTPPPERW